MKVDAKTSFLRSPVGWILMLIITVKLYWYYARVPCTTINTDEHSKCFCNGENFCFQGMDEDGQVKWGKPFDCKYYERLKEAGLLDNNASEAINDFETLNSTTWIPVILSVVSSNHFEESKPMLDSIKKHYPEAKIIYYDAGLTEQQADAIRNMTGVEYRRFNFSKYPAHVPNLKTYAFKLAQIEVFEECKTFYYFDASVRVIEKLEHLEGVRKGELPPACLFTKADHSVYAAVHPDMLQFFPMPRVVLYAHELEANAIFFSDSSYTRYVFKWWFLCSMTEDCIAPLGAKIFCNVVEFKPDTFRRYMDCHRFDQAFFNIIMLAYMFGEQKGALHYKYVEKEWNRISDELIEKFDNKRLEVGHYYGRSIRIERFKE